MLGHHKPVDLHHYLRHYFSLFLKETKKSQKNPLEIITTYNYLIVKESFSVYGFLPDFLLKRICEKLLTKRTTVLSTLATGFKVKILTNNDLMQFYKQKKHVNSAKQYVPFDRTFIRPIVELARTPKRLIPDLPISSNPARIPLGIHFLNTQRQVGLNQLPKQVIIGGSEQYLLIAALQYYIKALVTAKKKVIIFDYENEFKGIIPTSSNPATEDYPITVRQVGRNFQLNICAVETPDVLKSRESKHTYQASVLANILAFASGNRYLNENISHLQTKFSETMNILPSEELTLKNIVRSDTFTDSNTEQEFVLTEEFQVCLRLFADHPELNYQEFIQENNSAITPRPGVTLFQFLTPLLPIKRASIAFLIQLLAQRCDPEVVVIMKNASQLLTQEYGGAEGISSKLYVETMGDHLHQISRIGCLTLATYSLTRLHLNIQQANNTDIYFRFSNAEDREWITRRYALTQYMEDPNRFLQSLENEGLLINENTPYTIDQFVPYMETPVIIEQLVTKQAVSVLKSEEISREQFITLMTILELIVEADQEEEKIIEELESMGIKNPSSQVQAFKSQGYFIIREEGVKQIISISKKGSIFYQEYH